MGIGLGIGLKAKQAELQCTMEVYTHGWVISSPAPADTIVALSKAALAIGLDRVDIGLAQALGGECFVLTNEKGGKLWRAFIDARDNHLSKEKRWLNGYDTGTSALTIYSVLTGRPDALPRQADVPHDPDDFGRCHRLLELFPEWRPRLHEVAAKYPRWKGLVEHWDELTRLYEEKLPTGCCPKLYDEMQKLIVEREGE